MEAIDLRQPHGQTRHARAAKQGSKMVGHLPCKFSPRAWYFLANDGEISVEVIGFFVI